MDKWVLVTGSSRGIGKETALYLAKNGFNIVLHCVKNIEKLTQLSEEIKGFNVDVRCVQFDIKNRQQCFDTLKKDIEENGVYYGVVLNAGIAKDNIFPIMEESEWDDVLDTNLGGFYNVLKPIVFPMIEKRVKGRIVTMSSISGLAGNKGQVNYSASKAGIIGATKALSLELAKRGITVNCVAPGIIETDMIKDLPVGEAKKMAYLYRRDKNEEKSP